MWTEQSSAVINFQYKLDWWSKKDGSLGFKKEIKLI